MTVEEFVQGHREEIDQAIERALGKGNHRYRNDDERRGWILNDEGLYDWARSEGVEI
jgi:hypothetical protein